MRNETNKTTPNTPPKNKNRAASCTTQTMATKAIIGRGLREAGAALKHSSGLEVGDILFIVT